MGLAWISASIGLNITQLNNKWLEATGFQSILGSGQSKWTIQWIQANFNLCKSTGRSLPTISTNPDQSNQPSIRIHPDGQSVRIKGHFFLLLEMRKEVRADRKDARIGKVIPETRCQLNVKGQLKGHLIQDWIVCFIDPIQMGVGPSLIGF